MLRAMLGLHILALVRVWARPPPPRPGGARGHDGTRHTVELPLRICTEFIQYGTSELSSQCVIVIC